MIGLLKQTGWAEILKKWMGWERGQENKMTFLRITKEVGAIWKDMVQEKKKGAGRWELRGRTGTSVSLRR